MECSNERPSKKLIRSKSGLRIVVTDDDFRSPFVICEPEWTPDKEVSNCTKCRAKFGFTTRKHHCRRCGHIYCASCCDERLELPRMCFVDPVRICDDCAPATIQENKFFECHLKILTDGACFILNRSSYCKDKTASVLNSEDIDDDFIVLCKLSQDHRYVMFDAVSCHNNETIKCSDTEILPLNALALDRIKSLRVYSNWPVVGVKSMELDYLSVTEDSTNSDSEQEPASTVDVLRFSMPFDAHDHKRSADWILAMQQALKMIYKKCEENINDGDGISDSR